MSDVLGILLDASRVRVFARDSSAPELELGWDPAAPDAVVSRLRDAVDTPDACILVVGLGFLEIAQPDLPPLSAAARRAVLLRDADRYFPTDGPVAVAMVDDVAFAMPADQLTQWVTAFETFAPVRAVTTVAHAAALTADLDPAEPATIADGGSGDYGRLVFVDGALREARRVAGTPSTKPALRELDAARSVRAALRLADDPGDALLGDAALAARFASVRRGRWLRSAALMVVSLIALVWSANRWRDRTLAALQQSERALVTTTMPAVQAQRRLERAATEHGLLAQADAASPRTTPAAVLARLAALLPADAFVQRLEWDGTSWRIDGSAANAPRIVPLLDADAHFQDVKIVAASTRFLDNGRQRESFSIAFRTSPALMGNAR